MSNTTLIAGMLVLALLALASAYMRHHALTWRTVWDAFWPLGLGWSLSATFGVWGLVVVMIAAFVVILRVLYTLRQLYQIDRDMEQRLIALRAEIAQLREEEYGKNQSQESGPAGDSAKESHDASGRV